LCLFQLLFALIQVKIRIVITRHFLQFKNKTSTLVSNPRIKIVSPGFRLISIDVL
jgi:hypothetical protein